MREIKFRAWDKEKQFMFTPTEIEITQGENFTKWDEWRPMAWRDELPEEGSGGIGRAIGDECELMQYTGLKDKSGKEVYEGDILKEKDIITEVVFHDYQWKEKLISSPRNHLKNYFPFRDTLPFTAEVLGNIYENPELLKK